MDGWSRVYSWQRARGFPGSQIGLCVWEPMITTSSQRVTGPLQRRLTNTTWARGFIYQTFHKCWYDLYNLTLLFEDILNLRPSLQCVYSQGQAAECVEHMIRARCKGGGGSHKVAERYLKDPELRQWHLPARGILLYQLHRERVESESEKSILQGQLSVNSDSLLTWQHTELTLSAH